MILVCILTSFLLSSSTAEQFPCGEPKVFHRLTIKGDFSVNRGDWPWHAAIYHKDRNCERYACGGTLISEEFVLTAAHCTFNVDSNQRLDVKRIFVRLGFYQLDVINKDTRQFPVQKIHYYENFSSRRLQNDIAILELAEVVRFTNYILPACLSMESAISQGTAIGWGLAEDDEISPILKKVALPVIDTLNCLISDRDYFGHTLDYGMFCAGYNNGTTVCNGYSGGGFFVKHDKSWHLQGIISFIKKREDHSNYCSTDSYAGFTNVTDYIPWIRNITGIQLKE
ncbi:coagulation factor XI-like [Uranotaenia lowii]|uniref:coagulation factor XI-like n=1 Tax=Uranotaenia lowii TaxID=190385 RepID=UPI002479750B|nr:coagulation factor XI-like [Uranotaenia lowii]XP_055599223.1 coagulation factor XI-like [Uranotaenia lowii]